MNILTIKSTLCAVISVLSISTAYADGSIDHGSQASKHSALSVTEGASTVGAVASAAVAVPVVVVSGAVMASTHLVQEGSEYVYEHAKSHLDSHSCKTVSNKPKSSEGQSCEHNNGLDISDVTITADAAPTTVMHNQ